MCYLKIYLFITTVEIYIDLFVINVFKMFLIRNNVRIAYYLSRI